MALKLDELLKKAKDKGYGASQSIVTLLPLPSHIIKTWQQESVLYSEKIENKEAEKPNTNLSSSSIYNIKETTTSGPEMALENTDALALLPE